VQTQRHLIADASHELRTPIASLRANIQVLQEVARLPADEREDLRRTSCGTRRADGADRRCGGVGARVPGAPGALRRATMCAWTGSSGGDRRARRRGDVRFGPPLSPPWWRGCRADRSGGGQSARQRAQVEPGEGVVEVGLGDGVLAVRDHGQASRRATCSSCSTASTGPTVPGACRDRGWGWRSASGGRGSHGDMRRRATRPAGRCCGSPSGPALAPGSGPTPGPIQENGAAADG
jgi:hypothetical protein